MNMPLLGLPFAGLGGMNPMQGLMGMGVGSMAQLQASLTMQMALAARAAKMSQMQQNNKNKSQNPTKNLNKNPPQTYAPGFNLFDNLHTAKHKSQKINKTSAQAPGEQSNKHAAEEIHDS